MSNYTAEFEPFYTNGWENQPSENTPIMGEALDGYDSTLVKIEEFLANLDLSGLGADYALLTEAGYSLNLSVDSKYVLTIDLLNKAGTVLSSKNVDLPLESMFINATYANGVITLTLQNGNTLDVDISDIVRGLVPTSRTIAGIDLEDDVTKEELQNALEIYDSTVMGGELKPWLYDTSEEVTANVYNGKAVYRQTINVDSLPNSSSIDIPISEDIETILHLFGYQIFADGNVMTMDNARFDQQDFENARGAGIHLKYLKSSNSISILTNRDRSNTSGLIIVEYTKTTDAEGSGNNLNPYGIYSAKLDEVKADIEELQNAIVTTDSTTLENSHAGRVLFNEIVGGMEQGENPSTDNPQPINGSVIEKIRVHGKNLLNPATAIDNKYQNSANYGYVISNNAEYWISDFIPVEEGQVISLNHAAATIAIYDINKSGIKFYYSLEKRITIPSGGKYAVFCYPKSRVEFGADVMVCEGTDATYEPYQSKEIALSQPITLYNDVLTPQNVERKYKKFTADSSMVNTATKDGTVYINVPATAKINSKAYCTHNSGVKASLSGTTLYFTDSVNGVDADTYKAFLDNNEVEFVYELAESVIEELPTADKIALNSLPTYDGITYVEFIDVGVQPSVSIDYGTSKVGGMTLESLLTARNNDLRLSSLEASVVNNI